MLQLILINPCVKKRIRNPVFLFTACLWANRITPSWFKSLRYNIWLTFATWIIKQPKLFFFLNKSNSMSNEDSGISNSSDQSWAFYPPSETWTSVRLCVRACSPGWNWLHSPIWCRRSPAKVRCVCQFAFHSLRSSWKQHMFLGKTQTESKHDCRYVNIQNHMLVWELDNTGSEKSWEAV